MPVSNWNYKGEEIKSLDQIKKHMKNVFGFVYYLKLYDLKTKELIYDYIGKKNLYSKKNKKYATKAQKASMKNSRQKYIIIESDWHSYCSSNKYIKENKDKYAISREILMFCNNETELKYQEAKHIICSGALEKDSSLNDGVSLRMFSGKLIEK